MSDSVKKIAIVGAGPAGVYCALTLLFGFKEKNFSDYSLVIFDKAPILRTILPTGNGRCNITNAEYDIDTFISNYPRGKKILRSIFSKHFNYDSIEFFNSIGIETYVQEDLRVFPKSDSAKTVRDKMIEALKKFKNVKIINREIKNKDELKEFDYIVIATGTKTPLYPLKSFNHTVIPFKKALCALNIDNPKYPKGVSIKSLDGDFIFTDKGISGPLVFKLSSLNADKKFPYEITINLFNFDELYELVLKNPKKSIGNLVSKFVPKSFAKVHVIDFDKNACEVSKETLKNYSKITFKITSTAPEGEIVNAGGVELKELTNNLKSKIVPNLWFCGEVVDIDGFCGGFNLQNCWSGGYVVAKDILADIIK